MDADRVQTENIVAVAIDKGSRGSRGALRWVIDHHLVPEGQSVMLVHVVTSPFPTLPMHEETGLQIRRQPDEAVMDDVFAPYACFCKLRQVECEPIVLQHADVAEALREFIFFYGVDTFVLGGVRRHPLARIIRGVDVQTKLESNIPSFCTVYRIYNGRIKDSNSAVCPVLPPYYPVSSEETISPEHPAHELERYEPNSVPDFPSASEPVSAPASAPVSRISSTNRPDEFSFREVDISQNHSERQSTDSSFISFYKSLGDINRGLSPESMTKTMLRHYSIHSRNSSATSYRRVQGHFVSSEVRTIQRSGNEQ